MKKIVAVDIVVFAYRVVAHNLGVEALSDFFLNAVECSSTDEKDVSCQRNEHDLKQRGIARKIQDSPNRSFVSS